MLKMNFVPDEYLQGCESRRTNLMYLVLYLVVMTGLFGSFLIIKSRQHTYSVKEKLVDTEVARRKEDIRLAEELQIKSIAMWKTALMTAELLEPVSRSVLLASLTNNLPSGVSLLRLNLIQKKSNRPTSQQKYSARNKYQKAKASKSAAGGLKLSPERLLKTHIDIEGIAPSDLQVATYIERLGNSSLIDNVTLVESKEHTVENTTFRQFKLAAMLREDIHVTEDDVESIAVLAKK